MTGGQDRTGGDRGGINNNRVGRGRG